jgi:hypothetical protein
MEAGIPWHTHPRVDLPPSERAPDYFARLKVVTKVIFDEFIDSYMDDLEAQLEHSSAEFSSQTIPDLGKDIIPREPTGFWERVYAKVRVAGRMLREAHHMRATDPYYAVEIARQSIECLQQSALLIPHEELDWSLLDN